MCVPLSPLPPWFLYGFPRVSPFIPPGVSAVPFGFSSIPLYHYFIQIVSFVNW
ncbi:hypothetical protein BDQ12DRAFT_684661 [Crucibulum laeve]|uniref:Uncharacterized protein n=1 Tax=Crucibulum laeve TaxID=68775 RepID=A0A5C3LYW9_9AGAR|nr:hypothetical protein BDQ12DRAFT_684661 [Crucibulum laeve]